MNPEPLRHTILAVDDTPENLDILKDLLKDRYRVLAAKSGSAALDLLARTAPLPSLILLDIMMPGLNGFETMKELRRIPGCEALPVIFISAMDDVASKVKGLTLGAVDYITKPFEPAEVDARVSTQLALVEADRMKADIERIMRHDLKSPLNAILATAGFELSNEDHESGLQESLQVITDAASSMRDMIDLSLVLFKMEQGTYEPARQAVDLNALLVRIRRECDPLMGAGELTWVWKSDESETETACWVDGVELLCYSVLNNLLRNAIEASPRGGTVEVGVSVEGAERSVAIRNAGEIPNPIRSRLFQKYATNGKISGTGLGLYSAKLIATALGIGIEADVTEPGHTTFVLSFSSTNAKE